MKEDIRQMKEAGIDFAVLSVSNIYPDKYHMFVEACNESVFHFVPMVEVADFLVDQPSPEYDSVTLDEKTREILLSKIDMVLEESDSPGYLRENGKPVLFIHSNPYFSSGKGSNYDEAFWSGVLDEVEQKHGDIFWLIDQNCQEDNPVQSVFDSRFHLPSSAWLSATDNATRLQDWTQCMNYDGSLPSQMHVATVVPNYNNFEKDTRELTITNASELKSTYNQTWDIALKGNFDMILIFSWNEYFSGACIEPTQQTGTELLTYTKVWAGIFKAVHN